MGHLKWSHFLMMAALVRATGETPPLQLRLIMGVVWIKQITRLARVKKRFVMPKVRKQCLEGPCLEKEGVFLPMDTFWNSTSSGKLALGVVCSTISKYPVLEVAHPRGVSSISALALYKWNLFQRSAPERYVLPFLHTYARCQFFGS
jgi:hypothetical protein